MELGRRRRNRHLGLASSGGETDIGQLLEDARTDFCAGNTERQVIL